MNIKIQPKYNRSNRLRNDGKAPVAIEVYLNGKCAYFKTGLHLTPEEFDRIKNKGRGFTHRLVIEKMTELQNFADTFQAIHGRRLRIEDFALLKRKAAPTPQQETLSFTGFLKQESAKQSIADKTRAFERKVIARLQEFAKQDVAFEAVTYHFVSDFDTFLRQGKGLNANTTKKYHDVLKKYLSKAVDFEYLNHHKNPYHKFKPKSQPVDKEYLQIEEMRRIEELTFDPASQHLEFYRDVFLMGFYTAARISDVTTWTKNNFLETDTGLILKFVSIKTQKAAEFPLDVMHDGKPVQLIRKYWRNDGKPLFDRSPQKINKHIKEVFRLASIEKDKPLTFHTARHSSLTYLADVAPIQTVQAIGQHSHIKTTAVYLHSSQAQLRKQLKKVNW
jgi:integrase